MKARLPLSLLLLLASSTSGIEPGHVAGVITDLNGARVAEAGVSLVSAPNRYVVRSGPDGTYESLIRPGTYSITVRKAGFCDAIRAAFRVEPGVRLHFDFTLVDCGYSDSVPMGGAQISRPRAYQEDEPSEIGAGLRPLILYGTSEEMHDLVRFAGLPYHGIVLPVIYTYDLLTVRAEHLTYSRRDSSVDAWGDISFADGARVRHGSRINIVFHEGKPTAQLTP
jgi:hypothetical protein